MVAHIVKLEALVAFRALAEEVITGRWHLVRPIRTLLLVAHERILLLELELENGRRAHTILLLWCRSINAAADSTWDKHGFLLCLYHIELPLYHTLPELGHSHLWLA